MPSMSCRHGQFDALPAKCTRWQPKPSCSTVWMWHNAVVLASDVISTLSRFLSRSGNSVCPTGSTRLCGRTLRGSVHQCKRCQWKYIYRITNSLMCRLLTRSVSRNLNLNEKIEGAAETELRQTNFYLYYLLKRQKILSYEWLYIHTFQYLCHGHTTKPQMATLYACLTYSEDYLHTI